MTKRKEDLLFFGPSKLNINDDDITSVLIWVLIMRFRKLCIEAGWAPKKVVFCLQILMLNVAEKNPQKPPQTQHTQPKSCEKCHNSRIKQIHKVQTYCTQVHRKIIYISILSISFAVSYYLYITVFRKKCRKSLDPVGPQKLPRIQSNQKVFKNLLPVTNCVWKINSLKQSKSKFPLFKSWSETGSKTGNETGSEPEINNFMYISASNSMQQSW